MQRSFATRLPRQFSAGFGLYALVGGLLSFLGWVANVPALTDWDRSGISILPNTSLAAIAAGCGVLLLARGFRWWTALCGLFVALIGASVLYQNVTGADLGIDTLLLFGRTWGQSNAIAPGRMGLPAAISWTCLGVALMAASTSLSRLRVAAPTLAVVTTAISALSLIGHIYGASSLFAIPTATIVAFQTSTFILALSLGLILAVPDTGPGRILIEDSPAGILVRRFLPAVFVVPIVLGLLRLTGQRAGLYDLEFGTAIRTVAEIALLAVLLWLTTRAISRQSRLRQQAEQRVLDSERRLREQLEQDLADSRLLQGISSAIIQENDEQSLYEKILDAAVSIMRSQFGSMQMFHRDSGGTGGRLKLLAYRGFPAYAADRWQWVGADTTCACGLALHNGLRVIVPNVAAYEALAGSEHLATYQETGIAAIQSTPLLSRTGRVLGMISTHWNTPHEPSERELRLLDILARLAADLLERRQNEDALRDADRRKDEFLATLAHELRNPLAPVRSAVDLMEDRLPPEGDLIWARGVIDRQVGLMSRLLDDLLDVGRIAQDRLELKKERLDLRAVIQTAAEMSRPLLTGLRHELQLMLPAAPVFVDADPARLSQIFGNLLNNACRYTPAAGHIFVTLESAGGQALVKVRDNGIGIGARELPSIFEMFFQVDQSLERSQGGLGIGLHLARRLVEMHGGTIDANSRGRGHGSEFVIRMPIAAVEVEVPPLATTPAHERRTAPARRILVVDDNVDAATSMAMLLSMSGHDTHVAHDGPDALDAAVRLRPDVILLDIGLPRVNGYDVCRRIREQDWGRHIVIVAVTGWGQDLDRQRSEAAGFNHHIVKPVEHGTLLRLLTSEPELV